MSKYNKQNRLDEKAISIISDYFMNKHGDKYDLQFHGIKDNTPDTDGFLRLRQPEENTKLKGSYLNNVVFFQLKGFEKKIEDNSYLSARKLIDFCKDINLPTILFVVANLGDNEGKQGGSQIYWYHFSNINIEILNKTNKPESINVKIPNLSPLKIGKNDFVDQFYIHIKNLTKKNEFLDLPKEILDIAIDLKNKILLVASVIYLVGKVTEGEKKLITEMIGVTDPQMNDIIVSLHKQNLIYKDKNLYIFKLAEDEVKRDVGLLLLYESINKIDLKKLLGLFTNQKQKKEIYSNLAKVSHPIVFDFLNEKVEELLTGVKNNDDIFNELEILEEYAHMAPRKAFSIIERVYKKKSSKPTVKHIKGFGKMYGKSHEDILVQCIKILSHIRYLETKRVFRLLEKLNQYSDKTVQSETTKAIEQISQYNLFVLQQVEYRTQELILSEIEKWNKSRLIKNLNLVLAVSNEMLEPTFEGQSMPNYKTFTLHSGPLVVTDKLKTIRKRNIAILKKLYILVNDLPSRVKILAALQGATQTPHSHLYEDSLEEMILNDTNTIIDFYLEILPKAENELIQDIEEQKIWFARRFTKTPPQKLEELAEAIKSNSSYNMFKVFVGYDGRLDPDYDFNRDQHTRTDKVQEFVSMVSSENFDDWKKKILTVVKNYSGAEPGSYGYFEMFLLQLGEKKPNLAIQLINSSEKQLAPFLLSLLSGIWKSEKKEAQTLITKWIAEGKYLLSWGFIFIAVDELDLSLLKKVLNKARVLKDASALNNILRSILHHYPKNKGLKSEFIEVIKILSKIKNTWWVNNLWFKGDSILDDLSNKDWESIFNGLLIIPTVDYHTEEILVHATKMNPKRVVSFFHDRVEIKSKKRRGIDERYDGVPFNFHKLGEELRTHAEIIVPILLSWYNDGDKKNNWLYQWEASHMFEKIFPSLDPVLERALINLIKKGTKESRRIIFSILSKYKGGSSLWGIVEAMVKEYASTKEYEEVRGHLFGYLSQTGVVMGEDGFVKAYEAKKAEIQPLKINHDKTIKKFVEEYEEYLNNSIIFEQKRTNEEIELMKRGL